MWGLKLSIRGWIRPCGPQNSGWYQADWQLLEGVSGSTLTPTLALNLLDQKYGQDNSTLHSRWARFYILCRICSELRDVCSEPEDRCSDEAERRLPKGAGSSPLYQTNELLWLLGNFSTYIPPPPLHYHGEIVSMHYAYSTLKCTLGGCISYSAARMALKTRSFIPLCHCLTQSVSGTGSANSELRLLPPSSCGRAGLPWSVVNAHLPFLFSSCFSLPSSAEADLFVRIELRMKDLHSIIFLNLWAKFRCKMRKPHPFAQPCSLSTWIWRKTTCIPLSPVCVSLGKSLHLFKL